MNVTLNDEDLDNEELLETINDINWEMRFSKDKDRIIYLEQLRIWLSELLDFRENKENKMKELKELKDTVELMLSDNFEDRLKAEFAQLDIRLQGLTKFLESEKFTTISAEQQTLLTAQFKYMSEYFYILFHRLQDLGIK